MHPHNAKTGPTQGVGTAGSQPPHRHPGLTVYSWTSLVESGFINSVVTGYVGAGLGLILFDAGQMTAPPWLLMSVPLSILCAIVAYTRSWKSVRDEHETAPQWDDIEQSNYDMAVDRIFEIPYLFTMTILPFSAIAPQAFMVTLALFYIVQNYYNVEFARAAAGVLSGDRNRRVGVAEYVDELAGALWRALTVRGTGIDSARRTPMVNFFLQRAWLNVVVGFVMWSTLAATTWFTTAGNRDTASLITFVGLVFVLGIELIVDPARNLPLEIWSPAEAGEEDA